MNKVNATLQTNKLTASWLDIYIALGAMIAVILGISFS